MEKKAKEGEGELETINKVKKERKKKNKIKFMVNYSSDFYDYNKLQKSFLNL